MNHWLVRCESPTFKMNYWLNHLRLLKCPTWWFLYPTSVMPPFPIVISNTPISLVLSINLFFLISIVPIILTLFIITLLSSSTHMLLVPFLISIAPIFISLSPQPPLPLFPLVLFIIVAFLVLVLSIAASLFLSSVCILLSPHLV